MYIGEGRHRRLKDSVVTWRKSTGWAYKAAGGRLLEGPVAIEVELYKPAVNVPFDVDNSLQNILNALKGIAYHDDDQVYLLVVAKMWPDGQGHAVVRVKKVGPVKASPVPATSSAAA